MGPASVSPIEKLYRAIAAGEICHAGCSAGERRKQPRNETCRGRHILATSSYWGERVMHGRSTQRKSGPGHESEKQ
jgi:hypothetical protein